MKKLIILLLIICSTVCNLESCENEKDTTKCSSHTIDEIDDYSCRLIHSDYYESGPEKDIEIEENEYCQIYPDSKKDQKIFWRLIHGQEKELLSAEKESIKENMDNIVIQGPTKNCFCKNETVEIKFSELSNEEIKKIQSANSCAYQYAGRFLDHPEAGINITDKNTCFNAYQFSELKNLVNCGHATITYNTSGNSTTINTCFFIPDNHLPNNTKFLFKRLFIDSGISNLIYYSNESRSDSDSNQIIIETLRKLNNSITSYEVIVEDKYGKKYKYVNDVVEPEVIEEGTQGNRNYGYNDSKMLLIQINLLLLIISLILY